MKNKWIVIFLILILAACAQPTAFPTRVKKSIEPSPTATAIQSSATASPIPSPSASPTPTGDQLLQETIQKWQTCQPTALLTPPLDQLDLRLAGLILEWNGAIWQIDGTGKPALLSCMPDSHLSNTGRYVIFQYSGVLWLADVMTGEILRASPLLDRSPDFQFDGWSEDDRYVLMLEQWQDSSGYTRNGELWTYSPRTGKAEQITDQPGNKYWYEPGWPGKPERLLYFTNPPDLAVGENTLGYLNIRMEDGSVHLWNKEAIEWGLAFNHAGDQAVFGTLDGWYLWSENGTVALDCTSFTLPRWKVEQCFDPLWSPDDRLLMMTAHASGKDGPTTGIAVFDLKQGLGTFLHPHDNVDRLRFQWSPDGQWATLFTVDFDSTLSGLWVLAVDGSQEVQMINLTGIPEVLWSADSESFIFHMPCTGGCGSWIANAPDWIPDSLALKADRLIRLNK